jgi:hypothetical protein
MAQACAFFGVASPDTNLAEASLQSEHFHLISRLGTGTDYLDCDNVLARKMFRGDRACGPGSEVGDKSIVEDERGWGAGMASNTTTMPSFGGRPRCKLLANPETIFTA